MIVADLSIDGTSIFDAQLFAATTSINRALYGRPGVKANTQTRPDGDGVYDLSEFYDAREFTIPGRLRLTDGSATSFLQAHDLLGTLLLAGIDHVLRVTFTNGTARELTFRTAGEYEFDGETNIGVGRFTCPVRAGEVRWFNASPRTFHFDPTGSPGFGITNPFLSPIDGAGPGQSVITFLNAGNIWTPPVYVFTGPWFNPWLQNQTTGVTLYTRDSDLAAGETLTIDTAARDVYLGPSIDNSRVDWSASDGWPVLVPGPNVLVAGGAWASGASLDGTSYDAHI